LIVAAFDPGLAALGQARVRRDGARYRCELAETLHTPAGDTDDARMLSLWQRLTAGDVVAVEAQHGSWVGSQREGRSSANAVKVREVVGMLRARAYTLGVRLVTVTPQQIRAHLGLPKDAAKQQIRTVVERLVDGLPRVTSQHARDALAIGIAAERIVRLGR
jgi:Holliday junction resolvasome RuvABC endonuclease subunit